MVGFNSERLTAGLIQFGRIADTADLSISDT